MSECCFFVDTKRNFLFCFALSKANLIEFSRRGRDFLKSRMCVPFFSPYMNLPILGFQRFLLWPKCEPFFNRSSSVISMFICSPPVLLQLMLRKHRSGTSLFFFIF